MKNNRKMNISKTDKLLKMLESKIDKLVEKRVQKLLPMLVEHEVNRLLREQTNGSSNQSTQPKQRQSVQQSPKKPVDLKSGNITESLRQLVGGDISEWRSLNYNTQTGIPTQPNIPTEGLEGRPVDTSNPAVKNIMNVMNGNLGEKFKKMDAASKRRNGRI